MKYVLPILSLIISGIALAVALPRPNNLGFDYLGVIVAIISLATAFAVGFQIWNALSLEKRLEKLKAKIEADNIAKINSLEQKLTADLRKKSENSSVVTSHKIAITTATIALSNKLFGDALYFFVEALEYESILSNKFGDTSPSEVATLIMSLIERDFSIQISDPEKQSYIIKTIIESRNEKLIEKIGVIKSKIFSSEN